MCYIYTYTYIYIYVYIYIDIYIYMYSLVVQKCHKSHAVWHMLLKLLHLGKTTCCRILP